MSLDQQGFDPNAPEGDIRVRSQYVSKKDVKVVVTALVILSILLYPVYQYMKGESEKSRCKANLKAIGEALALYAQNHDDRLPPLGATDSNGNLQLDASGLPYTWIDDASAFLNARAGLTCPSAQPNELTSMQHPTEMGKKLESTYGMYAPYASALLSIVENPDEQIVVGETSNFGASGSYDPLPLKDSSGKVAGNDGFVIGWNNDNLNPTSSTDAVTRLAYPGTSNGTFREGGETRHPKGNFYLNATGGLMALPPSGAVVHIRGGMPALPWAVPVTHH